MTLIWLIFSPFVNAQERHTNFDPTVHGFAFANTFKNDMIKELDVKTNGLCGGMVYAALDYYLAGKAIPRQDYRPAVQTRLHDYIYDRQVHSIADNIDKWIELGVNPLGARNSEFFKWGLQGQNGGRIQELRQKLDRGQPVPLGLWHADGHSGGDHQVLAIGYKMGRYRGDLGRYQTDFAIYVYDPNYPNETRTLKADPSTQTFYYTDKDKRWLTYFVDRKYRAKTPPTITPGRPRTDGKITALRFEIETGGDDLRGGNDNLNIEVNYFNKASQKFNNVNNSRRWIDNYVQTIELNLREPVERKDLSHFMFTTTFYSGMGKDKWNMDRVKVYTVANGQAQYLIEQAGKPLHRFRPEAQTFRLNAGLQAATTVNTTIPPIVTSGNRCHNSIQGKIAWDYKGNKRWGQANLDKLCGANNQTDQPGKCFNQVMHGGVNWGGGTQWQWKNALELCQNTLNANRTVVCFKKKISQGGNWSQAIAACKR